MSVQVVGCSHQSAPIAIRERLAFGPEQYPLALEYLREKFPEAEFVLLSTCNRVELYAAMENGGLPGRHGVVGFLADFHDLDPSDLEDHLYDYSDRDMVRHLFTVAASLDSMVVGEAQISSQVKSAYQLATEWNTTGPLTHALFQAAAKAARCVAKATVIHEHRVSIPSVAVSEFAQQIFDRFDDKAVLVIGAGEMGEETLRYLQEEGACDVTIVNRNPENALKLAQKISAKTAPWERLQQELAKADLVISTTGASNPIVTTHVYSKIGKERGNRPLFILDLAVPRDFEPAVGEYPGVYLYAVDDLQAVCNRNRKRREKELPAALRIIERETDRFMRDFNARTIGPAVSQLKRLCAQPKEQELQRLFNKLPELNERAREEISKSFDRLANKLIHPPLESLREEAQNGEPSILLDALARLFQFKD